MRRGGERGGEGEEGGEGGEGGGIHLPYPLVHW